jgi:hypothetical protein
MIARFRKTFGSFSLSHLRHSRMLNQSPTEMSTMTEMTFASLMVHLEMTGRNVPKAATGSRKINSN